VFAALSEPANLVRVQLGEAFAMTSEYFAACAVSGTLHDWFFSINSYRHRTPARAHHRAALPGRVHHRCAQSVSGSAGWCGSSMLPAAAPLALRNTHSVSSAIPRCRLL